MNLADPHHPSPSALEVRPETSFRLIVGGTAVAVVVACTLVGVVMASGSTGDGGNGAVLRPFVVLGMLALVALLRTAGWHTLRSVRVEGDELVLEHADRTTRRLPLAQVGGLGYRGSAFAGRLFDGLAIGGAVNAGRLLVLDRDGRLIIARRAGWMAFDDLRRLCERAGLVWVGHHAALYPVVPVPAPSSFPAAIDPSAPADVPPPVQQGIAATRRARRVRLTAYLGVLLVGIALCVTGAWLPEDQPPEGPVIFAGAVGVFLGTVLLLLAPANENRPRKLVRALRRSRWVATEVVVAAGLDSDGSKRLVGFFGPDGRGAPVAWTKLGTGGNRGWFQDGERRWLMVAWDEKRRPTAIATLELDHLLALPEGLIGKRPHQKATDAYLLACEREHWNPDTPAGVAGPALALVAEGTQAGWGSAPNPMGAGWNPPLPPAPGAVAVPGTPPPGWVPPPAWQAPPAWTPQPEGQAPQPAERGGAAPPPAWPG